MMVPSGQPSPQPSPQPTAQPTQPTQPTADPTEAHVIGVARASRWVSAISESATLAVDAKAKALKAAGRDVIGFGAGEPDFATPDAIVEAAIAACRDPRMHHYTPAGGLPELKEAIAAKTARDSSYAVE